ncbi:uncharacterized protein LOC112568341 [Pomacea canaliculata]|uniref:uncharacterized protein LOC112568341 n=1 Tax=Pomacea canaliculata TaxID=400727 RepID=UPI000D72D77F|nr:uncharacterized protein LOC112568341 [Pomacea canaliculata]
MAKSILVASFGIQRIIYSAGHIMENTESDVVDDTASSVTTVLLSCVCFFIFISITAMCILRRRSRTADTAFSGVSIYTDIANRRNRESHTYTDLRYQDLNFHPNRGPILNPNPNHRPPSKNQDPDNDYEEVVVLPLSRGPVVRAVQMTCNPAFRASSPAAFK